MSPNLELMSPSLIITAWVFVCNQTVNLNTDSKTVLQFTEIKYSPSIVKHNKD